MWHCDYPLPLTPCVIGGFSCCHLPEHRNVRVQGCVQASGFCIRLARPPPPKVQYGRLQARVFGPGCFSIASVLLS